MNRVTNTGTGCGSGVLLAKKGFGEGASCVFKVLPGSRRLKQ